MDSPGPRLPWEVIERAIDHCHGHRWTLQNLALTCRQLLPRTHFVMFAHVRFKNRDHVFAFVDFLRENPRLMPAVRSITARPLDLAPVPLLSILPRLLEIRFAGPETYDQRAGIELGLHRSTLLAFEHIGRHIHTLHLFRLHFETDKSFIRMLLAFVHVTHLICDEVEISAMCPERYDKPGVILWPMVEWRLSQRTKLEALTVGYDCLVNSKKKATNLGRTLDSITSVRPLIASLTITQRIKSHEFFTLYRWHWSSLRSLTLQLSDRDSRLGDGELIAFLERFITYRLTDITLEWRLKSVETLCKDLSLNKRLYEALDSLVVQPCHQQCKIIIICTFTSPLSSNGGLFWLGELGKHLPGLSQRGAVVVRSICKGGEFRCHNFPPVIKLSTYQARTISAAGHDGLIYTFEMSMDGKWAASGSDDSTIILWDAENGMIARQWVAHDYNAVRALAFSPDGQYLVSIGEESSSAVIWDLSQGACRVATLDGPSDSFRFDRCAWSPDGQTIATGSWGGVVQLWDARTFQLRALCELGGEPYPLAFSPDGRWLIWRSVKPGYVIIDVVSGTLHKSLHLDPLFLPPAEPFGVSLEAAFDPTSTHLAIASEGQPPRITVFNIETGNTLLHWKAKEEGTWREYLTMISFSPNGRLVLGVPNDTHTCYIWDAFTGAEVFQLRGHERRITAAKFSPCGKYIASCSWDETIRLWRTCDGSCAAILSEDNRTVQRIAFSPNGKTLASADLRGRVIIRRMRDIIPPVDIQDDNPLIVPADPASSITEPGPHPDDCEGLSPDNEAHAEEPLPTEEGEKVGEPEEWIDGDAARSGRLGQRQPLASASTRRDDEEHEDRPRTGVDSPTAGDGCAWSVARHSSSGGDSTPPGVECIPGGGDLSTSSARLSSVAPVDGGIWIDRGRPPSREAPGDMDGAGPVHATETATWENERDIEENATGCGAQDPIAAAFIWRDEDGDEGAEVTCPTADEAKSVICSNSEAYGAVVADFQTRAVQESAPYSSSGVSTTSSARLSFLIPAAGEASIPGGQLPSRKLQGDAKGAEQGQAMLTIEVQNAEDSAASPIAPPVNRAINEPEGRGVVDFQAAHPPVTRGDSGSERESVTKIVKAVARNVRSAARRVARDAKECCEKLTMFGAKLVLRRRERRASAFMP